MKLFDCFTYFNEEKMLEFRLEYLNSFVDYFVICESAFTFSGKPKDFTAQNVIDKMPHDDDGFA